MIDNFETIENFMHFERGYFYMFSCLVRNSDGDNELYTDNMSNTDKNLLVRNYFVDNLEYYEKIKPQMIQMCKVTGARLYVALDKKSVKKVLVETQNEFSRVISLMLDDNHVGIRRISKIFNSKAAVKDTSDRLTRTIMFDIDTKDEKVLKEIVDYVKSKKQTPRILNTRQGWHVFCYKKFKFDEWSKSVSPETASFVSVKEDQLGLVYHPTA